MMDHPFARTEILVGTEGMKRLANSRVAVFGIGGVGGYVVEALARSGVGTLDLIDHDKIEITNLNRQIFALHSTLGRYKADVAKERVLDINPAAQVYVSKVFFLPETAAQFDFTQYDYVVDAIDTVTGKIALIEQAQAAGTPIISSMGAGNKMDPAAFRVADIYETTVCPLAKVMRRELKKRGIQQLKVVYSTERPCEPAGCTQSDQKEQTVNNNRKVAPGSNAFVPSAAGLVLAGAVVQDLMNQEKISSI